MKTSKLCAAAFALATSFSASAITSIADADLSQVSGQEGVSIVADLNMNIGSFTYTDDGASVSFNNIGIKGMMVATIDILQTSAFQTAIEASITTQGGANGLAAGDVLNVRDGIFIALGYIYPGTDVVQIAFPAIGTGTVSANARLATPTITVASMTTGHGGASFGGLQIKNLDLQGTKIWMFGHP